MDISMSFTIPGAWMAQLVDYGFYYLRFVVRFSSETHTCLYSNSAHTEFEVQPAAYPTHYSWMHGAIPPTPTYVITPRCVINYRDNYRFHVYYRVGHTVLNCSQIANSARRPFLFLESSCKRRRRKPERRKDSAAKNSRTRSYSESDIIFFFRLPWFKQIKDDCCMDLEKEVTQDVQTINQRRVYHHHHHQTQLSVSRTFRLIWPFYIPLKKLSDTFTVQFCHAINLWIGIATG
jgi:hypothetical protein